MFDDLYPSKRQVQVSIHCIILYLYILIHYSCGQWRIKHLLIKRWAIIISVRIANHIKHHVAYQVNITEVIDRVLHPEKFEQEKKYVLYAINFMLRASTIIRHLFIIFHCYLIRHFLVSVYSHWSCDVHMCPCACSMVETPMATVSRTNILSNNIAGTHHTVAIMQFTHIVHTQKLQQWPIQQLT